MRRRISDPEMLASAVADMETSIAEAERWAGVAVLAAAGVGRASLSPDSEQDALSELAYQLARSAADVKQAWSFAMTQAGFGGKPSCA